MSLSFLFLFIGAAAFAAPLPLLAWTPLLVGPAHILADLRYLVFKPKWHLKPLWWGLCALPLALSLIGGPVWGLIAVAGALMMREGNGKWIGILLLTLPMGLALQNPFLFSYSFLFIHNLITLGFGIWWARKEPKRLILPLLLFASVSLLFLTLPAALLPGEAILMNKTWLEAASLVSYGLSQEWAMRMGLLFIFWQLIHYSVWLYWIPSVGKDFGFWVRPRGLPLLGVILVTAGLGIYGTYDVWNARLLYLKLAGFHGYLELTAIAFLWKPKWGKNNDTVAYRLSYDAAD